MQFLAGCSRSSAEAAQPKPEVVTIDGVGPALKSFETTYELFDIDVLNTQNRHNEKNVSASCYGSGFFSWLDEPFTRDTTRITGSQVNDREYRLTVNVNSETGTVMWAGDVTTTFTYDSASRSWTMSSTIFENGSERAYQYCAPAAVADTLIANLQCYLGSGAEGAEAETLQSLVKSLGEQRDRMIERAGKLYVASDCEQAVDPKIYENDTPVPMGF